MCTLYTVQAVFICIYLNLIINLQKLEVDICLNLKRRKYLHSYVSLYGVHI